MPARAKAKRAPRPPTKTELRYLDELAGIHEWQKAARLEGRRLARELKVATLVIRGKPAYTRAAIAYLRREDLKLRKLWIKQENRRQVLLARVRELKKARR